MNIEKFALLLLFFSLQMFSQSTTTKEDNKKFEFEELFGGKRVFINKAVTSYNFTSSTYKNEKEIKNKTYVNFDKPEPSKIFINSDDIKVTIRVNSRYFREDLYFEFARIYKVDYDNEIFYYTFLGKSSCEARYTVYKNGYNQFLLIKCLDQNKNGDSLLFTMSQNEQL